jgi:hypothetical protein
MPIYISPHIYIVKNNLGAGRSGFSSRSFLIQQAIVITWFSTIFWLGAVLGQQLVERLFGRHIPRRVGGT